MLLELDYPLVHEISYSDPVRIFSLFSKDPFAIFLDSAKNEMYSGRYSFIAIDPFFTMTSKNNQIKFGTEAYSGDPFLFLQQKLKQFSLANHPDLPPFQGGMAGYFSYDLCQHLETIPAHKIDDLQFADLMLGFYDVVFAFDHQLQKAWIFSSGFPEQNSEVRKARAKQRLEFYLKMISSSLKCEEQSLLETVRIGDTNIHSNFTTENYQGMVQQVIDYIHAGDIFQANVSQRFQAALSNDFNPFMLYQTLREKNPSPFAAYLNFSDIIIASASPERFLKLAGNKIETKPIKGTRKRSNIPEQDEQLKQELMNSEKDRAENTMIVDLLRNDLSKVCCNHSVKVTKLCDVESFATVHHLVSTVIGELKPDHDAIDLLRATFPGGSITGAPKIRAMEIIAELEPTARGPYCGSIGYIGFDGNMDLSITIRTYAIKDQQLTFQAGGGIVAESNPQAEYEESLTKAAALKQILL